MKKQIFRMTQQRKIILEELRKVTSHPTAQEIFDIVKNRLPRISLGTVYRNLDVLTDQNLVLKLPTEGGLGNRFDANVHPHAHIACVYCHRVDDVPGTSLVADRAEEKAAEETSYKVMSHSLEFQGICPECQARHNVIVPVRQETAV
ncbi:MAG: Fur family transcriptional regulator [Candidatus Sumerlaeia bacterium]